MSRAKIQTRHRRTDSRISGEVRRIDDLRKMESNFRNKLAKAETRRLNAILAADRVNVGLAADRAEIVATNLAERVDTTAKAAAAQTEASATALRVKAEADAVILASRIAPLEQARYENAGGKSQTQESRANMHWTTERVIAIIAIIVAAIEFYQKSQGG